MEGKAKILVAAAMPQDLELMGAMLTLAGYEVTFACDGQQALKVVQKNAPDLVILDALMPKCDGYEVCAWLKVDEDTRLLPIILITSPREEI